MSTISPGGASFLLQFQATPIVLTGGVASGIAGGILPLVSVSNAISFPGGLLSTGTSFPDLDELFAYFQPIPGSTLIDQAIGEYPFANQTVAANAVIQQPLKISMLMTCPAGAGGGYLTKSAVMQSIQATVSQHNQSEGLYSILTPAFAYTNCVMKALTDVSGTQTKQVQWLYRWDFEQPLVTLQAAATAFNAQMSQIANNLPGGTTGIGPQNLVGSTIGASAATAIPSAGQGSVLLPGGGFPALTGPSAAPSTATGAGVGFQALSNPFNP
jgi:hypothetical protein